MARVLFRLAPVAQHLPAGAVREARDALVEAICLGAPANEQTTEAQEFAVGDKEPLESDLTCRLKYSLLQATGGLNS